MVHCGVDDLNIFGEKVKDVVRGFTNWPVTRKHEVLNKHERNLDGKHGTADCGPVWSSGSKKCVRSRDGQDSGLTILFADAAAKRPDPEPPRASTFSERFNSQPLGGDVSEMIAFWHTRTNPAGKRVRRAVPTSVARGCAFARTVT